MISLKVGHRYVLGSGDVIKIVSMSDSYAVWFVDEQGKHYSPEGIHDINNRWSNVVSEIEDYDRDWYKPDSDDEDEDDSDDDFELPDLTGPDDDFEGGGGSFGGGGSDGDW